MKILLATDGTPASTYALREAARLLPLREATVAVVAVADMLPVLSGMEGMGGALPELVDREERSVADLLARAIADLAALGVHAQSIERTGPVGAEILATAATFNADLVVLGSHGRNALERFFLGSVSDQVAHHWHGAVLVVRAQGRVHGVAWAPGAKAEPEPLPPRTTPLFLVATDGSPCSEHAMREAARLLPLRDATVELVAVADAEPYGANFEPYLGVPPVLQEQVVTERLLDLARAQSLFTGLGIATGATDRRGEAGPEIVALAKEMHPDVVVVGSHGRGVLVRWMLGSVSDYVLHHGIGSTLIVGRPRP